MLGFCAPKNRTGGKKSIPPPPPPAKFDVLSRPATTLTLSLSLSRPPSPLFVNGFITNTHWNQSDESAFSLHPISVCNVASATCLPATIPGQQMKNTRPITGPEPISAENLDGKLCATWTSTLSDPTAGPCFRDGL